MDDTRTFTAFSGVQLIATGPIEAVLPAVRAAEDAGSTGPLLVFEDQTGSQIDFDLRGTAEDILGRLKGHPAFTRTPSDPPDEPLAPPVRTGPGRPRLGVVSREVSLLPRHWEWLERQKGGASATLRALVDAARKARQGEEPARQAWEAAGRFMWVVCGNLPGFEEASRALHRKEPARLAELIQDWPADVRAHAARLVDRAVALEREAHAKAAKGSGLFTQ